MSSPQEREVPRERIRLRNHFLSPVAMAKGTADILDIYFKDLLEDPQPGKDFLEENTIAYLNGAERGLSRYVGKVGAHRNVSIEDMDRMFDLTSGDHRYDPDDYESFDFSVVVFGMLPEVAKYKYLPMGFSRRGMVEPPFTTTEYLQRIKEMRREVARILVGQTIPRAIFPFNKPLWRTKLFFDAARQLPDMHKQNPAMLVDKSREVFERLLGDIAVDFNSPPPQETGM